MHYSINQYKKFLPQNIQLINLQIQRQCTKRIDTLCIRQQQQTISLVLGPDNKDTKLGNEERKRSGVIRISTKLDSCRYDTKVFLYIYLNINWSNSNSGLLMENTCLFQMKSNISLEHSILLNFNIQFSSIFFFIKLRPGTPIYYIWVQVREIHQIPDAHQILDIGASTK